MKKNRVLVLGDDMRSFLAIVRSLGRRGIEVHAVPFKRHAPALWSRYIDNIHHLPPYDGSERWISALRRLLTEYDFDLLIPCCDRSIRCLDAHREELRDVTMALPSRKVITSLFDKFETRNLAAATGVSIPGGRLLTPQDTAQGLIRNFGLPLLIKARWSYVLKDLERSGTVTIIRSEGELQALLEANKPRNHFLVEAYFTGVGVGVSVLASKGRILCAFQHLRLKEARAGGGSSLRQSEALATDLLNCCKKMAEETGLTGVAMFEFRVHRPSGSWVLLEVNARFWGSLPLPVALGVDFPYFLYQLMVNGEEVSQVGYPAGTRARNFVINAYDTLIRDTRAGYFPLKHMVRDLLDLASHPILLLLGKEKSDSFQRDDLRPAFAELFLLPGQVLIGLVRKRWPSISGLVRKRWPFISGVRQGG